MAEHSQSTSDFIQSFKSNFFPNYAPYPVIFESGKGSILTDIDGKEYIDFAGGIAVNALGHCHPALIDALAKQAQSLWHLSNYFINQPEIDLAKKLTDLTFADRIFLSNSGTEANECALKLARKYATTHYGQQKTNIISTLESFHGRSLFTVSVGGRDKYKEGFHPLPPGISHVSFNDCNALENAVDDDTCAVIIEPIQGEGGVIPATKEFLQTARSVCDKHQALLIFDEIQCGIGRTGKLFAYLLYKIEPDILTVAKALGCGIPISAVLTTKRIAETFQPGSHGSTFGGNALTCAVAAKAVDIISQPGFLAKVNETHVLMVNELTRLIRKYGVADAVRGYGLLLGIKLNSKYADKINTFCELCLKNNLLILQAGYGVVRMAPALNITQPELEEGLKRFEAALTDFK